jgi:hypothetical protein
VKECCEKGVVEELSRVQLFWCRVCGSLVCALEMFGVWWGLDVSPGCATPPEAPELCGVGCPEEAPV